MAFESVTDDQIAELVNCPKSISNPGARKVNKDGTEQVNYKAIALDASRQEFEIYKRQNRRDGMQDDFSCGLSWLASNGERLTLRRYNGPNHNHKNKLEKEWIGYHCHIHLATERYLKAAQKPEGFAVVTPKYTTLNGALHCLLTDCKISGLTSPPDNPAAKTLFET